MTLVISGLDLEEVKQLAHVVWEMSEKDPTRGYYCVLQGLQDKTLEEARKILREVFPPKGVTS